MIYIDAIFLNNNLRSDNDKILNLRKFVNVFGYFVPSRYLKDSIVIPSYFFYEGFRFYSDTMPISWWYYVRVFDFIEIPWQYFDNGKTYEKSSPGERKWCLVPNFAARWRWFRKYTHTLVLMRWHYIDFRLNFNLPLHTASLATSYYMLASYF